MSIHSENWDGVTPPAIPAGFNCDANLVTTATFAGGITPTSSPNALKQSGGSLNTNYCCTWATADSNSGNVTVQANCTWYWSTSTPNSTIFGLCARGSAATLNFSSTSFYWFTFDFIVQQVAIQKVISGTATVLGSAVSMPTPARGTWYQLEATLNGTALSLAINRLSDNTWLNSSGSFVGGGATAISLTDGTLTSAGYAGLTGGTNVSAGASDLYSDDWIFANVNPPPPPSARPLVVYFPFQYYPPFSE